ncbi:HD domain-containing protein [Desulfonatronovibrio hydrogenovorans]|uniref:HD domain-containing protein n=1 Tax=Desulfonatronovibrio hydrogenovorans TaxID=53245 RepID=UPI00068D0439|nr:HD domain-containing protein [Desulfonatronovibrio hydrogenovorans]
MRDFAWHESLFSSYCQSFSGLISDKDPNLILKKNHSSNVSLQARLLAEYEGFGDGLVFLTRLSGLLHDMGRFEQYARYRTFKDTESVDHAGLGFRILGHHPVLAPLSGQEKRCVRLAVLFHNRMKLPRGLPRDIEMVARAVRDADKLDIFPIMLSHLEPGCPENRVVTLGLDDEDCITPEIFCQVRKGHLGEYSRMRYLNDFKLLLCSWAYDLNYAYSSRIVLDKGYIARLFKMLPEKPELIELEDRITGYLEGFSAKVR